MGGSIVQAVNAALSSASISNYCLAAAFTVYSYDRLLALEQEIDCIWRRPCSIATALYAVLQLVTISFFVLISVQDFSSLDCKVHVAMVASDVVYETTLAVISSLRVYALNSQDVLTPVVVFIFSLGPVTMEIFKGATLVVTPVPSPIGCAVGNASPSERTLVTSAAFAAVGQTTLVIADAIVLLVTWRRTYYTIRLARAANVATSLSTVLLRDGWLLAILVVLDTVFYFQEVFEGFSLFKLSLSSIILSRFFLNLREASLSMTATSSGQATQSRSQSEVRFPRGLRSLGGSVALPGDDAGEASANSQTNGDEAPLDEESEAELDPYGISEETHSTRRRKPPSGRSMPPTRITFKPRLISADYCM
ncbi:hypothetical protein DAEQUDRAFT_734068 [Daedalea quercina L-15889]|uniref:DUF6533 domain-containing protein n=1 Tax=Daedalea quercina L-15889 TaxID=1314783 RepID=A0A165KJJ0_9APHY|nr:hypothetical protein DAEQUDRAFT_734068 [Daedalea quercina L-15889]